MNALDRAVWCVGAAVIVGALGFVVLTAALALSAAFLRRLFLWVHWRDLRTYGYYRQACYWRRAPGEWPPLTARSPVVRKRDRQPWRWAYDWARFR